MRGKSIKPFIDDCKKSLAGGFVVKRRRKRKPRLEKHTERDAVRKMRDDGAEVAKLNLMGQRAWPDRLVVPKGVKVRVVTCWTVDQAMEAYETAKRDGVLVLIEFKREGEDLTELQRGLQRRLMFGGNDNILARRAKGGRK